MRFAALMTMAVILLCAGFARADDIFIQPGEKAPEFRLRDQYEKYFEMKNRRARPLVLLYAPKEKAAMLDAQRGRLAAEFNSAKNAPNIDTISAAFLRGIPPILRTAVKEFYKNSDATSPRTLLDWKGEIALLYGFSEDTVCAYVIDREGIVRFAIAIYGSEDEKALSGAINHLLRPPKTQSDDAAEPAPPSAGEEK